MDRRAAQCVRQFLHRGDQRFNASSAVGGIDGDEIRDFQHSLVINCKGDMVTKQTMNIAPCVFDREDAA